MTSSDSRGHQNLHIVSRQRPAEDTRTDTRIEKDRRRSLGRKKHLHPGVRFIAPDAEHTAWRARYADVSGKRRTVTLERIDARTVETMVDWAVKLSEQLQRGRSDAKAGIVRAGEDLRLPEAVERFFAAHPRLSDGTTRAYRASFATLVQGRERLTTKEISLAVLGVWRDEVVNARRRNTRAGGRRGEKSDTRRLRSPFSVNKDLRHVGRLLEFWRSKAMLNLTRDDLASSLKKTPARLERRGYLTVEQIRELMTACAKHDALGKYTPITPLIRFLLLTGMRVAEALAIKWSDVVGDQINVPGAVSKTGEPREIDLTISPTALPSPRGTGRVFAITAGEVHAARKRLAQLNAPRWSPHALRRTCGTFLSCAPGIYGGASAFMSAQRLGHSVAVAEKHYVTARGALRIPREASTLEGAMQL